MGLIHPGWFRGFFVTCQRQEPMCTGFEPALAWKYWYSFF
jgi:hypothetical protein